MYFDTYVDTAFTACHIVSVAPSEIGIAGVLQHRVLFICRENGGSYQSVEGITWAKGVEESKLKIKNGISKK